MAFKSDVIFEEIKERIKTDHEMVKKVGTSFRINLTGTDGTVKVWTIDAKSDEPYVGDDKTRPVEIEINLKENDFISMATGKIKPDQAFMQGKMKLKGNIAKAMKLRTILDPKLLKAKL